MGKPCLPVGILPKPSINNYFEKEVPGSNPDSFACALPTKLTAEAAQINFICSTFATMQYKSILNGSTLRTSKR